jgi:ribonuclease BN (tRNA processing enzyme)
VRVTMIGSGDAFGSGGRFQTCIALAPDDPVRPPHTLVDCGATSLTALRQQQVDPNQITTVVLTHLHGDHFGGLPFLILDGQFRRRGRDLTVLGPPGTGERLRQAMETLYPGSSTVRRRFEVHVREHREREPASVDGRIVVPYEVRHAAGAPAYAVWVDLGDGTTMAYSGDTEWTDALVDVAAGVDLLLVEGYSPTPVRWHLDLGALTDHRDQLDCRRLLLTHLSPTALESDLTGWDVAHDGLTVSLEHG